LCEYRRRAAGRDATDALVERLNLATLGALELASVHVGNRLGFYRSLAEGGDANAGELASRTGTAERYVREWLEQQAVAGFLRVDDPAAPAGARRYALPAAHHPVFVEENSLSYLAPLATLAIGVLRPMDALLDAYRTGGGVPYEAYGEDTRAGIAAVNRPGFVTQLAGWLACIPEVDARLRSRPAARVADLACGSGWSSVAIARAYPEVIVDAIDADAESIEDARRTVAAAGLSGRVRPTVRDASDPELEGRYDLVTIFEALHDMNHPVDALRAARNMLSEVGSVVISDERVAERFTVPGDELERSHYGWSVVHCLPVGMLDETSAGTGAVIRPETVRTYAAEAGFGQVEVLPIEHDSWRFYRLAP
jgi:2-polyprenyl-3-methyl-5-hydroxy-6-metoxy-1,4-benzoquinol methylase